MICPKCELEQEERLDCKECGIVFSKYKALFPSSESSDSGGSDEAASMKSDIAALQIQVREINSQFIDAEFEKAERKKLRTNLKELEQKIDKNQEQVEAWMKRMEDALDKTNVALDKTNVALESLGRDLDSVSKESKSKISPEILENLPKSEEMEQKTDQLKETLETTVNQLTTLWEKTGQNSYQTTELRDQIIILRNDILETRTQVEILMKNQVDQEPKTIYEDDVKTIRKNLDELGQFISGLGRRQ